MKNSGAVVDVAQGLLHLYDGQKFPPKLGQENYLPFLRTETCLPKATPEVINKVDYRKLNDLTKKDAYPLPHIKDILALLHGFKSLFHT